MPAKKTASKNVLRIGLPKGSLQEPTLELFKRAGYNVVVSSRSYRPSVDDEDLEIRLLRAQEIGRYVDHGFLDCGITGRDWIVENGADVTVISDLRYSKATSKPTRWVLVVPENSPIKTLADLKGQRVAFGKGSSAQNVTVKALALAGLTLKDVQPLYLAPADATAAFNGGNLDAWVVWDPYFAIAQQHYGARVVADTTDRRLASSSYYLANRDFATKYPAALAATLDEIGKLTVWSGQHRDELSALAAEATGIDLKTWSIAFGRAEYSCGPVTPAHVAQQQALADSFQALGIIPRKINVADYVWQAPKG